MVLKAEMQSQETEPFDFYSSPLIEAQEDIQSGKFEAFLSITHSYGAKPFITRLHKPAEALIQYETVLKLNSHSENPASRV